MADDLRRAIRRAVYRMNRTELENLYWYLTLEGLV